MRPEIPNDLSALSAAELRELRAAIHAWALAALATQLSAEDFSDVQGLLALRPQLKALADAKDAEEAEVAAEAAAAAAATPAEPEVATLQVQVVLPEEVEVVGGPALQTTTPGPIVPAAVLPVSALRAVGAVNGKNPGDAFESWSELTAAAIDKGIHVRGDSSVNYEVARIFGNYSGNRVLSDDVIANLARFEQDEVMAAFCAPATPYYGISCLNTLRRPVFNSLPQFQAPRGKVSIMPSPTLADIDAGFGIWTDTDDDDPNARKNCETITCGNPTEYKMYGVWKCLTVKNLLAMTYPELVEAWLNRLGAAHSRLAETALLNAMATGASEIDAPRLGYGASVTITSTILNYLALYQETQRWDISGNMEAWLPRWIQFGMKMDIMRRRSTTGRLDVPTDGEIDTMFRNVGVNPHWFIDTPNWAEAIPSVASGGNLNLIPQTVQILVAQPGKFAVIDRGELAIGVTGNGLYRDNASNAQNQFTFFFENFEGIVNTNTCPAHLINIPVCWNGAQIDDIVINCQGGDEGGYQS